MTPLKRFRSPSSCHVGLVCVCVYKQNQHTHALFRFMVWREMDGFTSLCQNTIRENFSHSYGGKGWGLYAAARHNSIVRHHMFTRGRKHPTRPSIDFLKNLFLNCAIVDPEARWMPFHKTSRQWRQSARWGEHPSHQSGIITSQHAHTHTRTDTQWWPSDGLKVRQREGGERRRTETMK